MSLLHTAKLNAHEPYAYLKNVLERLPTQPSSVLADLCRPTGSLGPDHRLRRHQDDLASRLHSVVGLSLGIVRVRVERQQRARDDHGRHIHLDIGSAAEQRHIAGASHLRRIYCRRID